MKRLLLIIAALFISFNTFAQEVIIDGIKYNIIDIPEIMTVTSVIGPEDDSRPEEITIPQKIYYNNKYYTVNAIKNYAFGDYLIKVTCESVTPQAVNEKSFGSNPELKIYVPEGCVNKYKSEWTAYAQYIQEEAIVFKGGGGSSDWNVNGNWSGIPNGEIALADFLADKEVTISAAAIIPSNYKAEVKKFTIEDGGSITIVDGGQLIVHDESSTGNVTMEKNISKYSAGTDNVLINGWYTISSPFEKNYTLSTNNFLIGTYELFRYNEATSMWENQKAHEDEFTALEPGKGYLYANYGDQTISITGELNIGDQDIELTADGTVSELQGFNLIGNPFTHNIYKSTDNTIVSEGYFTLTNEGAWKANSDLIPIKPMQGFLVKTNQNHKITIAHSHKSRASKRSNKGAICINVANNEYNDVAYISFNKGIGLDKIEHRNNEIPMVYVPVDGTDYAIAIMDENAEEYPVNFEAKKMGEYTIGISAEGRKYSKLTLIDKQDNNKEIDMLKGNYTFLATTTDDPARFILKVSLNNNQEAVFYTENNSIIIDNMKGAATVHVYDVMGRPVMKYNTNDSNCQLSTSSLANGVYIIQLMDENGTQVQKVIVNN